MLKPNDYEQAKSYDGEFISIQPGGYVCKVLKAEEITRGSSPVINLYLDIAEGEFSGIMKAKYDKADPKYRKWPCQFSTFVYNRDGGTNPYYKGLMTCIERSNGFHVDWNKDERQLSGKLVGIIFRAEEFMGTDGAKHIAVRPYVARDVETIRSGEFRIPELKTLDASSAQNNEFIPVEADEGLPF